MGMLAQDVKYGIRMMLRTPVVTLVAVFSLALGIAANASMFAILNAFILEPFPYQDQDELAVFRTKPVGEGLDMASLVSPPSFRDYVAASSRISSATLYTTRAANLTGLDSPEQLSLVVATPSFFDVLGVQPALGRGFRPEEGVEGSGNVLVLGYEYWQRRFFGDRDVLGRAVTLDGAPYTIIGIMPESFELLPSNVQAFSPSDFADHVDDRDDLAFLSFVRMAPGATAAQVQREIEGVHGRLTAQYPDALTGTELVVQPLGDVFPGPTDTRLYTILTLVTIFGLLIACANIANLLLSRAEERQSEIAVRAAMGAGRGRVLRQLLTESVVMGVLGGVVGLLLSIWVVRWLQTVIPPEIPRFMMPELDPVVVLATIGLSIVAGIVFGMAPALQSVGTNIRDALGGGARGGTAGRRRKRVRNAFVIGEVAVALALLSASGFLIQTFDRLSEDEPGLAADHLLTFDLAVLDDRYGSDADVIGYDRELLRVLGQLPSVESATLMSSLPRSEQNPRARYAIDGRPAIQPSEQPTASFQIVSAEYFATLDVELLQGRLLQESDREDTPAVAVISEALARREFPGEDALGQQIVVGGASREIVGVVENILQERMQLAGDEGEQIYVPLGQNALRAPSFALRTTGDPTQIAGDVREAVWSVEADQPIASLQTLEAHVAQSLAGPRAVSVFLLAIGLMALALAAIGIYGVMAQSVAQQQREIGIRMALGASRGKMIGMVTRSGLTLVGVGTALGLPVALLMVRTTIRTFNLFDVDLGYGYTVGLGAALLIVAVLSTLLPARRASSVTPVAALKE